MQRLLVEKHGLEKDKVITLANGDRYDSKVTLFNEDYYNKAICYARANVDPTNSYNYKGEIEAGDYVAKMKVRKNGMTVWELETLDGKKEIPATKPNPLHGGKKVMVAVQIHSGGKAWDGSHGCITIHPADWYRLKETMDETVLVTVVDNVKKEEENGI